MNQQSYGEWGGGQPTEELATLVERGRQLHSQAVFQACARLLQPLKGLATKKTERFAAGGCELGSR